MPPALRLRRSCAGSALSILKEGFTTRLSQATSGGLRSQIHHGWFSIHQDEGRVDRPGALRLPNPHGRSAARGGASLRRWPGHGRESVAGCAPAACASCEPSRHRRRCDRRRCREGPGFDERRRASRVAHADLRSEANDGHWKRSAASHPRCGAPACGRDFAGRLARPVRPGLDRAPRIAFQPGRPAPEQACKLRPPWQPAARS